VYAFECIVSLFVSFVVAFPAASFIWSGVSLTFSVRTIAAAGSGRFPP
jgi:divalent metal cation (Fe/Co/Zn/Cd) transporter